MDPSEALDRLTYHAPNEEGRQRHEMLTDGFLALFVEIETLVPEGREKSLVFTKLEEAKFWASAGVARNPKFNKRGELLDPTEVG